MALALFIAANVLANAGLLWLACRLFRVGGPEQPVSYLRALGLTLLIFLIGWPLLALVVGVAWLVAGLEPVTTAKYALPPLGVAVPLAVLFLGLRLNWWRTLGVWLVWRVASLIQAGLALLVVRSAFADALPPGWRDYLP